MSRADAMNCAPACGILHASIAGYWRIGLCCSGSTGWKKSGAGQHSMGEFERNAPGAMSIWSCRFADLVLPHAIVTVEGVTGVHFQSGVLPYVPPDSTDQSLLIPQEAVGCSSRGQPGGMPLAATRIRQR